ncbi:hypothetical protein RchiOBHm_Chr1g0333271 [Rosa chinensis]|uniref:Uncharacterized protein n=1 Tax=Rosa chinensis TaxID=74649 RepID=A0A2P6SBZ4_ROSCH|nr:hypothetical protein RchiOBHm_Chr1g0333271 [Rosa chinensis]
MSSAAEVISPILLPSLLFYFFLNPPHLNPQTPLSFANCSKLHPFDATRVTSPRPDPSPGHD